MIINFLLFISIGFLSYIIIDYIIEINLINNLNNYIKNKNEKYYDNLIKKYEKDKRHRFKTKMSIFYKINMMLDRARINRNIFINPLTILIISICCFFLIYFLSFDFFKVVGISFIISLPCTLFPIFIIICVGNYKNEKIENIFLSFLLQLRNYTKINNDIVFAMEQIETLEPLQSHINIFLLEINSGIKFEAAIENLKNKINVEVFKNFLSNVEHCYLYGGNFTELIDKNYKLINEIQTEKNNRIQETKSARLVLFILIALDIFVYIINIKNNYTNYIIMQKTLIGNIILYWNFISLWFLIFLSNKVKKLDY